MTISARSYSGGAAGVDSSVHIDRPSPAPLPGDQLWAVWTGYSGGGGDGVTSPGFTEIYEFEPDEFGAAFKILRRIATVAEPSGYTFTLPSGGNVHLICVHEASPTVPARIATMVAEDNGSRTPSVTPASGNHLEIRVASFLNVAFPSVEWGAPAGYVLRGSLDTSIVCSAVATRTIASSAPSGVQTFARDSGNITLTSTGLTISIPAADLEPETPPPPPFTPAAGTADFQYVFRRMLDRAYLGHLDLSGVSFERRTSSVGAFSASLPITSSAIGDQVDAIIPRDRTQLNRGPGVIVCEILHKGDYWGEYWITGYTLRKDRRQAPVLQLRGSTLEAYPQHVRIRDTLDFTGSGAADQFEILRQLLITMQARPHANLGLILPSGDSGQVRERLYEGKDRTPFGQRIQELGDVIDGFEWTFDTITGAAGLDRVVRAGSPTIGDPDAGHVFGMGSGGGDIIAWGYEVDALKGGTVWEARGDTPDTEGDASVSAEPLTSALYEATDHLEAGWPAIERLIDRPGVKLQETLEEWAQGWAARKSGAVTVFSVTIAIGENPSFTPNNLGDTVRVVMSDEYHKRTGTGAGLNARHRVIGTRVLPVGRDQGKAEMELIVESSEVT